MIWQAARSSPHGSPRTRATRRPGSVYRMTGLFSQSMRIRDRKSTRLNSSHSQISYAVFCLKKKKLHNLPPLPTRHSGPPEVRFLARLGLLGPHSLLFDPLVDHAHLRVLLARRHSIASRLQS